jgi:ABC-type branched-subunit amino acid transport system ATPase component
LPTDAIIARGLVLVPEGRQLFAELTVEENCGWGFHGFDRGRKWRSDLELVYRLFHCSSSGAARRRPRCPAASSRWSRSAGR